MPSTLALIRGMFTDRRERTVALGIWTASFSLGGLLGPVLGGLLLERYWWGSVFLVAPPVTATLLVLGPRLLPAAARGPEGAGFDLVGATQSLLALLALVYAVKRTAAGAPGGVAGPAALAGLALGAAFVRRQRRRAHPMIDPAILRRGVVRVALLGNGLTFFALYGTQVAVAQYLQWGVGLAPLRAGLWTLPATLAYLAGTQLGPRAAARFAPLRVVAVALVVCTAGCLTLALVAVRGVPDLAATVAGTVLFGVGLAPVYTLSTELILAHTRPERAAGAGAVAETGAELGGALGIALLGSLGVAVYRHAMGGVAGGLPPVTAAERAGYEQAYAAIAVAAASAVLGALVVTVARLRSTRSEPA
jgi:MFS transporter, DHA2 family, multidrug resistance protein